ncbi:MULTISPECIES: hypothetical protein [unclassified Leisingera]|uniref:hypothetical protein n=1 Tax=unclassified Leisingera TaxID=2614906 RepID=UPI00126A0820|nr:MULTISPECIES: hypothetical protein [unclassified Leisingera]
MDDTTKFFKRDACPPAQAEVLFRHTLRAVPHFNEDMLTKDSANRVLRALLTIGSLLHAAEKEDLLLRLRAAEAQIDIHDLTIEDPATGEQGTVLADGNLTRVQHSFIHWLSCFDGRAHTHTQQALENYLGAIRSSFPNALLKFTVDKLIASERELDEADNGKGLATQLLSQPLYRVGNEEKNSPYLHRQALAVLNISGVSFWLDWYQGFLDGKPLDWKLQQQVAMIDNDIWQAGSKEIDAEIERIRADFAKPQNVKDRFPKHEPKSVSHLFENRVIASASLQGLAAQITHSIERFHAETGANALPEALEALAALPALLLAVNATIQAAPLDGAVASETEDQLRAEIGRLNAKVAQLENELQKACSAKPSVFSDAFKKQLGTSLGDWKLYAALCTGLWFVSGDAEGTQRRLENISLYHDMIFGEVSSPSKSAPKHPTATTESTLEI